MTQHTSGQGTYLGFLILTSVTFDCNPDEIIGRCRRYVLTLGLYLVLIHAYLTCLYIDMLLNDSQQCNEAVVYKNAPKNLLEI